MATDLRGNFANEPFKPLASHHLYVWSFGEITSLLGKNIPSFGWLDKNESESKNKDWDVWNVLDIDGEPIFVDGDPLTLNHRYGMHDGIDVNAGSYDLIGGHFYANITVIQEAYVPKYEVMRIRESVRSIEDRINDALTLENAY